jgi:hypothetical protein
MMRFICQEWWMQQIEVQAACPGVKNKCLPKHTLKTGLRYLYKQINKEA